MKHYKVQWAYPLEVGSPTIHNNEANAAKEVGYLLGTWIRRDLQQFLQQGQEFEAPNHPEFFEGMRYLLAQIQKLFQAGKVWDAYDLWEDFYLRFENEFGKPLYAKFGVVIVEGSPDTGLKNKIPFIERAEISPYEKYRKEGEITVPINRREDKMDEIVEELREIVSDKAESKNIRITQEQFLKAIIASEKSLRGKFQYQDEQSENEYLAAFRDGILKRLLPPDTKLEAAIEELVHVVRRKIDLKGVRLTQQQFQNAIDETQKSLEEKFSSQDDPQYLAAFREGVLRKLFPKSGMGLGAMTSWLIQYADFGGASHAGRHTSEERAKQEAGIYLMRLMQHLESHAGTEAIVGHNKKYVKAAAALLERLHYLLSDDLVWTAYLEYKEFEEEWSAHFNPIPLEMAIGTMRVIPRPEPEPENS